MTRITKGVLIPLGLIGIGITILGALTLPWWQGLLGVLFIYIAGAISEATYD